MSQDFVNMDIIETLAILVSNYSNIEQSPGLFGHMSLADVAPTDSSPAGPLVPRPSSVDLPALHTQYSSLPSQSSLQSGLPMLDRGTSRRRALSAPARIPTGRTTKKTLATLPGEMLLEIVGWVGAMSPVHRNGESALVNFSRTSYKMRELCRRQLFRAVVVEFTDLYGPGKYDGLLNPDMTMHETPDDLRSIRCFALKAREGWRNRPRTPGLLKISRAGLILIWVLRTSRKLEKLTVTLPPAFQNFRHLVVTAESEGNLELRFVKELIIDKNAHFLLDWCPNITSVTLVGFSTLDPRPNGFMDSLERVASKKHLRRLEIDCAFDDMWRTFPRMDHLERFVLVGEIPRFGLTHLWSIKLELTAKMPQLKSLTLVVTGRFSRASPAPMLFQREAVVAHWARGFFKIHRRLEEFGIACMFYDRGRVKEPRFNSYWKATRPAGGKWNSQLQSLDGLTLGSLSPVELRRQKKKAAGGSGSVKGNLYEHSESTRGPINTPTASERDSDVFMPPPRRPEHSDNSSITGISKTRATGPLSSVASATPGSLRKARAASRRGSSTVGHSDPSGKASDRRHKDVMYICSP
ncbi:hypothetical protein IWX90DRAFT_510223 [Phyllosticta citrichinensis]|uniref:F-box domain-containing protein n=1 Tax=Phyllosticta citrichinensis TaxID=1130410 RepID=A0ABR1Y6U0_9PEZI